MTGTVNSAAVARGWHFTDTWVDWAASGRATANRPEVRREAARQRMEQATDRISWVLARADPWGLGPIWSFGIALS